MRVKKSKKSSSSSKRRDRSWSRSPSDDSKSKRTRPRSKSVEKEKSKEESKSGPRKTRWQAAEAVDVSKSTPTSSFDPKPEKSSEPLLRIKDLLHDREKILDLLFRTVTGAALRELIPDYLKKRSLDDIKKLCLEQIKAISDEDILQVISGNVATSNKDEEKKVEKEPDSKTEQPDVSKDKEKENTQTQEKKLGDFPTAEGSDNTSSDILELHTTPTEMESILDEDKQIPLVVKAEVAKDLITPEQDAELLELMMRARAIRALLRAKGQKGVEEASAEAEGNT